MSGDRRSTVIFFSGRSPLEEIGGGHCAYVRACARAACEAGYEVHLYCVSRERTGSFDTPYGTVHHAASGRTEPRQRYIRRLADPLARFAAGQRDVWSRAVCVHSFGVWAEAGRRFVEVVRPERRIRHVMSMYTVYRVEVFAQLRAIRGLAPGMRLRYAAEWLHVLVSASRFERAAYRSCDTVAVNYACVKTLVTRCLGPHPDIRVTAYGPESAFLPEPGADPSVPPPRPGRPVIVSIILQRPKKGVEQLLQALAALKKEGVAFDARVIGGGSRREDNRMRARELGIEDDVLFTGFVPDVDPWLAGADLYVQPSLREESGSLALLEAMRLGRPVVCSSIDGMAEDVRDGIDGITVPAGDAAALAAAIRHLLLDGEARRRYGDAARRRFDQRHGHGAFSRAAGELYEHDQDPSA